VGERIVASSARPGRPSLGSCALGSAPSCCAACCTISLQAMATHPVPLLFSPSRCALLPSLPAGSAGRGVEPPKLSAHMHGVGAVCARCMLDFGAKRCRLPFEVCDNGCPCLVWARVLPTCHLLGFRERLRLFCALLDVVLAQQHSPIIMPCESSTPPRRLPKSNELTSPSQRSQVRPVRPSRRLRTSLHLLSRRRDARHRGAQAARAVRRVGRRCVRALLDPVPQRGADLTLFLLQLVSSP